MKRKTELKLKCTMESEGGLAIAAQKGSVTAWEQLYEKLFDPIYRYVFFRVNRNVQDTEDVVQETFLAVVRSLESYRPERGDFYPWAFGIAKQKLAAHYRTRKRQPFLVTAEHPQAAQFLETCTQKLLPETECLEQEFLDSFAQVFSTLPPNYQEALTLKYVECLEFPELASQLGLSVAATKSLVMRAKEALREAMRHSSKEISEP